MTVYAFGRDLDGDTGCNAWAYTARTPRFRSGYQIAGSEPIFCGTHKDLAGADAAAKNRAANVRAELLKLGAATSVSWWVQEGLTVTETTWEEPKVEPLC